MTTLTKHPAVTIVTPSGFYSRTQLKQLAAIDSLDVDRLDTTLSVNDSSRVHGVLDQCKRVMPSRGREYLLLQIRGEQGWCAKFSTTMDAQLRCMNPNGDIQTIPLVEVMNTNGMVLGFLLRIRGRHRNCDDLCYYGMART